MKLKYILLSSLGFCASSLAMGQELSRNIPAQAEWVTLINNKAIVQHSSYELLNDALTKLGAFKEINSMHDVQVNNLNDLGINFDKQSFIYGTSNDSLNYVGVLLPLNDHTKIEGKLFSTFKSLPDSKNYKRRVSADGATQVAWNNELLFVLTGSPSTFYFDQEAVAARYGIQVEELDEAAYDGWGEAEAAVAVDSTTAYSDYENNSEDLEAAIAAGTAAEEDVQVVEVVEAAVDSTSLDWTAHDFELEPPTIMDFDNTVAIADTASIVDVDDYYANDAYTDSIYQVQQARAVHNDSIRNSLFVQWLALDFEAQLQPIKNLAGNKAFQKIDNKNTLARFWVKDVDLLYQKALPYSGAYQLGFGIDMQKINYGYQDGIIDLIQDGNTLKMTASVGLDKDVQKIFKNIYQSKFNKKMMNYIPENHLGYLSLNINSEAYLKEIPALIERYYAPLTAEYADMLSIASTALEIGLDEKAIGKVMKGDHLLFINEVQKVNREYIDYVYDDEYNYEEVTKTKEEYIPNFLWMFTSEDQRLFEKALKYAEKHEVAVNNNGLYTIKENETGIPFYVLMKDNIVFIGNNEDQLAQIKNNSFKGSKDAKIKKAITANTMNLVAHANAAPDMLNKLGIPILEMWEDTVAELPTYGDVYMNASGLKNQRISGEIAVEFPKKDNNALQFLLNKFINQVNKSTNLGE